MRRLDRFSLVCYTVAAVLILVGIVAHSMFAFAVAKAVQKLEM